MVRPASRTRVSASMPSVPARKRAVRSRSSSETRPSMARVESTTAGAPGQGGAADARAAAERHHRRAVGATQLQRRAHVVGAAGLHHGERRRGADGPRDRGAPPAPRRRGGVASACRRRSARAAPSWARSCSRSALTPGPLAEGEGVGEGGGRGRHLLLACARRSSRDAPPSAPRPGRSGPRLPAARRAPCACGARSRRRAWRRPPASRAQTTSPSITRPPGTMAAAPPFATASASVP